MTQRSSRRIYIGLFLLIILIIIPYFLGGTSGIMVALIFAIPFAAIASLVMLSWRIPFFKRLQTQAPTLSLVLKTLIMGIVLIAFFIFVFYAAIPPM